MSATNIYATSADMISLCDEFEDTNDFHYVYLEQHKSPKVVVSAIARDIELFWTSPSGFLGRSILLVPKGYEPKPRVVELKTGGRNYHLSPVDVEKCVVLQEGGIFSQEDCLISGRLTITFSDDWSRSTFNALSRLTKKRFSRIHSYYLGAEAKRLLEEGYRLTFQSCAPRSSDLSYINSRV